MSGTASASQPALFAPAGDATPDSSSASPLRRARVAFSSAFAVVLGLAPHILHHAGPLAGAALFAGVGGSLLFGTLGFILAIPFLMRLHRRFESWRPPLAALVLFATVFSISTFVLGPAITGAGDNDVTSSPAQPGQPPSRGDHEAHH